MNEAKRSAGISAPSRFHSVLFRLILTFTMVLTPIFVMGLAIYQVGVDRMDRQITLSLDQQVDFKVQELENHPDIVGIYCNSASNCIAMCHALKRTDKWKHIAAISSDIFAELEPYLMDGTVDASIWQAPEFQSKEGVCMLYEYLSGQHLQQEVRYVQLGIVMKNNFHDYL